MQSIPTISVIVTTWRRPQLALRAVESVLAQNLKPLEVIVVEDGPATGLGCVIGDKFGANVVYHAAGTNRGLGAARNAGFALSKGEWVAFLDDDDLWTQDRLSRTFQLLVDATSVRSEIGVLVCGVRVLKSGGDVIRLVPKKGVLTVRSCISSQGLRTYQSSLIVRRSVFNLTGGYDERVRNSVDHDFWMRLSIVDPYVLFDDECLVIDDCSGGSMRLTFDGTRRADAVCQFLSRWAPAIEDIVGKDHLPTFTNQYLVRVLGALTAEMVVQGRLLEAVELIKRVGTSTRDWKSVLKVAALCCRRGFGIVVPARLRPVIRRILNVLL